LGKLGIAKMKKIPGAAKPPGIFLQAATLWNFVKSPSRQVLIGHLKKVGQPRLI